MALSRSATRSVLAITAMLASALGIVYMASVSYPDELGIIDARQKRYNKELGEIAGRLVQRVQDGKLIHKDPSKLRTVSEDAARFVIGAQGDLIYPARYPLRREEEPGLEGVVPRRGYQQRQRSLAKARDYEQLECGFPAAGCAVDVAKQRLAHSAYEELLRYRDSAAQALLGLARLHRSEGQPGLAASRYQSLREQYARQSDELGVPYVLLADLGLSEVSEDPGIGLSTLRKLVGREYYAPSGLLWVVAEDLIRRLEGLSLSDAQTTELKALAQTLERRQEEARFAERLAPHAGDLFREAESLPISRVAPWAPDDSIVFVRAKDGTVHGRVVSRAEIVELALQTARDLGLHKTLRVDLRAAASPANPMARASQGLGPLFSQWRLDLRDESKDSDPIGDIEEARRRHRAITGGLVVVLALGLFATIRGAARERELSRLKSDFVSTVSHELKTPLTSIRMFAEMLQQGLAGDDPVKEKRYHGIIVKESERLGLLIANLLDYSQVERGTRQYESALVSLTDICEEAIDTFSRFQEGELPNLKKEFAESATSAEIRVDREVTVLCVLNLLNNAAKYGSTTEAPAEIELAARVEEGIAIVEVRDKGPGIAKSEHDKVFREFYRSPSATQSAIEGTGLGLALVKRHVEAQGGAVVLSSAVGQGATFQLKFPIAS